MSDYLRVRSGFVRNGRVVKGGEVVAADDPIVTGLPEHYFEPLDDVVEQATRRPGERRVLPGTAPDAVVMAAPSKGKDRKSNASR